MVHRCVRSSAAVRRRCHAVRHSSSIARRCFRGWRQLSAVLHGLAEALAELSEAPLGARGWHKRGERSNLLATHCYVQRALLADVRTWTLSKVLREHGAGLSALSQPSTPVDGPVREEEDSILRTVPQVPCGHTGNLPFSRFKHGLNTLPVLRLSFVVTPLCPPSQHRR